MIRNVELETARRLVLERGRPPGAEKVGLMEAHGRVLAEDICAPMEQPSFNRSPLDGYALRAADTVGAAPGSPAILEVIDTVHAGSCSAKKVTGGTAVRLMTGSPIPEGADCVIRQENTRTVQGRVEIFKELSRWDNYCCKGEYCQKGDGLLGRGELLRAADIGILASLGIAAVPVYQKPAAAVLSTGDELVEPGTEPAPGQVYSSNCYTMACRLKECGVEVLSTGIVGDDRGDIERAVAKVIDRVDFVVTTGGASVGEKDLIMETMGNMGAEIIFWKIKIKPGSPALFSVLKGKPVVSLSGNPFAAAATFELLLPPFLEKITGNSSLRLKTMRAVLQNDFNKKSPIRRALRGRFVQDDSGKALVQIADRDQSPGNLQVALDSNCFIDIQKGSAGLKRGEMVQIYF